MKKPSLTLKDYEFLQEEGIGMCIACGYQQDDVEPDARKYTCEDCEKDQVYGAEELLLMGYVA